MLDKIKGNKWITLVIISVGFFMILIDTTVVNVSIPTIIKDLHANLSDIEWVISGYALAFAALLITFGRLGDIFGRKTLFILGLAVFTIASIFSGEAQNANALIIARLFQGVGGAMISPATLSILSSSFVGKERSIAFGIWGSIAGIAVAVGPILGGFLTTYYSWRWVFRINIPIGIVGIILSFFFINQTKNEGGQKIDVLGMITSTVGFFLLVFALIEGQTYGWIRQSKVFQLGSFTWNNSNYSIIFVCIILSIIFLGVFLIIEYIKSKKNLDPSINLEFFQFKSYRYGLIAIAVISLGEFSSLFTLPIFLQSIKGFTPLQSGEALLPLAFGALIAAPTSARLVNTFGTKRIITSGIFLEFLGILLVSRLDVNIAYISLVFPLFILGCGIGFAIAQNTQVTLSEIPHKNAGSASGVLNTIRQVGSAFGIAVIGAVLASQLNANIKTNLDGISGLPQNVRNNIITQANNNNVSFSENQNTQQIPPSIKANPIALEHFIKQEEKLASEIKSAINLSLTDAISASIRVGSVFVLLGAILSLFIPNIKHED